MMFKSGIMLATAATGLLVGSPLAYAACNKDHHGHTKGDHGHTKGDHGHRGGGHDNDGNKPVRHESKSGDCNGNVNQANVGNSSGLVNVSNVNLAVPINACGNDILSGALGILAHDLRNNDNH
jgi:hypothetical protein